jgi:PST family polysaccharide transporter
MRTGRQEAKAQSSPISGRRLAFGAAAMGAANVVKIALQLALLPIMARLLGPAEFGLYSLALPTVVFVIMLADGGLGNSLAREDPNARTVWSSAFWAVQISCLVLTGAVVVWSHLLAAVASQPQLPPLMSVLSLSLILLGFCIIPSARLLQAGRIGAAAWADLGATLFGALVGVAMAATGWGAWSLVGQYLSTFVLRVLLLNLLAPFVPAFTLTLKPLLPHLAVGGGAVGIRLVDFAGRLIENSMVSRFVGAAPLGSYSLSNQAPRMICEGVSNPIWAAIYVQALRHEPEAAAHVHERLTRLAALTIFPVSFIAAAAAPNWVHLLLGEGWEIAGPMFMIFLPTYGMAVVGGLGSAILFARGRTDVQLGISTGWAALRVGAVALTPFVGLMNACWGVGGANLVYAIVSVFLPARLIGATPRRLLGHVATPLVAAAAAAVACWFVTPPAGGSILMLLATQAGACVLYAAVLMAIQPRRVLQDLKDARALIKRG